MNLLRLLRLAKQCAVCRRFLWFWQGQTTATTYTIGGNKVWSKPHIVCSDGCADLAYAWGKQGMLRKARRGL